MKFATLVSNRRAFPGTTLSLFALACWVGLATLSPQSASAAGPLAVGDKAPDFELPVQGEDSFLSLSDLVKDGPVVVVVLRGFPGYQCPICSRQVGSMMNRGKTLMTALGNQPNRVVFVYPGEETGDTLDQRAKQFVGSKRLSPPFVMVRDPGMEMVKEWGLRWDEPRETAYPSVYLVGPGSRVKWSKVSKSHGGRASVEEILTAIKNL